MKLLRFHATWCQPCKRFEPIVNAFAEKHGLTVQSVDIDEAKQFAEQLHIMSVPTTLVLDDQDYEVHRFSGAMPTPILERELAPYI